MSIIYEALKKIESEKKPLLPEKNYEKSEKNPFQPHLGKRKIFLSLIFYSAVFGLIILSFQFIGISQNTENSSQKETKVYHQPQKKTEITGKIPSPSGEEYILEGVVDDGQSPFAIINGKVLRNYDIIDDYMVTNISKSGVEMVHVQNKSRLELPLQF